jgi:dTDP-4-amino-4,6-dideoxygalactose transaminase
MDDVLATAERRGWSVVEDAAQAIGATWRGRCVGTLGVLGCISFHPSKNLAAAGDGGAIVCREERHDVLLRRLRALGQRDQNEHLEIGLNSKLGSMQAVVLDSKLDRLAGWNARRRTLAAAYRERLADLPLTFQESRAQSEHVYHLFQVRTPKRDALLAHLRAHGVDAVVRYPVPIHRQPAFAHLELARGRFPVAERLADELLALPLRPDLNEEELEYVCATVRGFFAGGVRA